MNLVSARTDMKDYYKRQEIPEHLLEYFEDAEPTPATVIDVFSGSGTTIQVARKLGRRGIGLDISAKYLDLSKERLGIKGGLPLFEEV